MRRIAWMILFRAVRIVLFALTCLALGLSALSAHEVSPAIADFHVEGDQMILSIRVDVEAIMAGLDLSATSTGQLDALDTYEELQSLSLSEVTSRVRIFWPDMASSIFLRADGKAVIPQLISIIEPTSDTTGASRLFTLNLLAKLPGNAGTVSVGWARSFGPLVLRQNNVESPYDGYLEPGNLSPEIDIGGGNASSTWGTFLYYIPIGFEHIVPMGLDHILFVLGLFLFDTRGRQLLLQITAFTAAHTVTLAAASVGFVTVPSAFVEPAIAASIVYVAVENIYAKGSSSLRLPLVFVFGLLHGLGFASVLDEFGLPETNFVAALLGFNVGVEVGQISVVLAAFLLIGLWFRGSRFYRPVVVVPGSTLIGATGAFWLIQRVI